MTTVLYWLQYCIDNSTVLTTVLYWLQHGTVLYCTVYSVSYWGSWLHYGRWRCLVTQSVAAQSPALAAAPALPGPFQGLTHSDAESRWHPFKAVVQCNWTTVCCFECDVKVLGWIQDFMFFNLDKCQIFSEKRKIGRPIPLGRIIGQA